MTMQSCRDVGQQGVEGHFERGFGTDSGRRVDVVRLAGGDERTSRVILGVGHTYLFTFWPPGPDDLLKVNSPIVSRGIVCACSAASHVRAASRPSSAPWAGEPEGEEDEEDDEYGQQQTMRRGKRVVAGEQRTTGAMQETGTAGRRMRRGWSSSRSRSRSSSSGSGSGMAVVCQDDLMQRG